MDQSELRSSELNRKDYDCSLSLSEPLRGRDALEMGTVQPREADQYTLKEE
jgi:hypothetical protein